MAVVDLDTMPLKTAYTFSNNYIHAVAVAPDNMVVLVDYFSSEVIYGMFDPNLGITSCEHSSN